MLQESGLEPRQLSFSLIQAIQKPRCESCLGSSPLSCSIVHKDRSHGIHALLGAHCSQRSFSELLLRASGVGLVCTIVDPFFGLFLVPSRVLCLVSNIFSLYHGVLLFLTAFWSYF
jgi:hypothetical protein